MKAMHRKHAVRKLGSTDAQDGEWLLKKADEISGFVAEQRNRTQKAVTKTAWGAAAKQLSVESEVLTKQLQQLLQQAVVRAPDLAQDAEELLQLHEQAAADGQLERLQLLAQVQDLSGLVHSIRCYGIPAAEQQLPASALASLKQELSWLAQDIATQSAGLGAETEQLLQEIAADVKLALSDASSVASSVAADGSLTAAPETECESSDTRSNSSSGSRTASCRECTADGNAGVHCTRTSDNESAEPIHGIQKFESSSSSCSSTGISVAGLSEVHVLLAKYPLATERLRHQVLEVYSSMAQQHQQQMQQLAATVAQQGTGQAEKYGGWSADDHALFVKLRSLAFKTAGSAGRGGRGCSRTAVLDKLSLMMPGKSKTQLKEHDVWCTAACLHQRRTADLAASWQRQLTAFLSDSGKLLEEASAAAAAGAEAAAARLAWEAAGSVLAEQLQELQSLKQEQQQEIAAQQEAEEREAAAKAAAARAHWEQDRAAKKVKVAQYKQQLAQQMAAAKEAAARAAAEAATAAQAAIAAQQPAVAARQAERWDRLQQQLEQQRQRQDAIAARQARLDAIAAVVAPHVPSNPQRLLQPTAASDATPNPAGAAFKPVHGYTTAQVVADPRFRVVEALHSAGLLRGAAQGYVRGVVQSVPAATVTRADNMTSAQLQAAGRLAS